jgi:hypothetical protein
MTEPCPAESTGDGHVRCVTHHACDCHQRAAEALRRIADMPYEPRADGTYNYDRNALVQIARTALGRSDA